MGFAWTRPPSRAWPELANAYAEAIRRGVYQIAQRRAPEIEAWLKNNAPWTDRTGNARQTLNAPVEPQVYQAGLDMVEIILAHGVEYGIFLELSNAGRYAIIAPALDHWGPILWADIRALLS